MSRSQAEKKNPEKSIGDGGGCEEERALRSVEKLSP